MSTTGDVVPRESGDFLTCVLAAPIAAMGTLAVGERRGTWDRPGRSAVLGLVAACLGIEREDEDAHQALEAGYGMALRVEPCSATKGAVLILAKAGMADHPSVGRRGRCGSGLEPLRETPCKAFVPRRAARLSNHG